jgi:hypothetical protein
MIFFSGREYSKRTSELLQQSVAADMERLELISNDLAFKEYFDSFVSG